MRSPAFNTITRTGRNTTAVVPSALPVDALSAPDNDSLITSSLSMWPQGPAWSSPDRGAISLSRVIARLTRVFVDTYQYLYGRGFRLALESSASQTQELLPEWEFDYGLPEKCFTGERTTEQRMRDLLDKVNGRPALHPEDFVGLAADYGFEIEIEEPAIFECGFSECGGFHQVGPAAEEVFWIIRVRDAGVSYFECGVSEVGYDPLFSYGLTEELLCLFRRIAPAWTIPVIEPWINLAYLVTETGEIITDEYGNAIAVPI